MSKIQMSLAKEYRTDLSFAGIMSHYLIQFFRLPLSPSVGFSLDSSYMKFTRYIIET